VFNSGRGLQIFLIVAFSLVFVGCSMLPSSRKIEAYQERIQVLERELRRRQAEIQELKEKNLVLEQRLKQEADPELVATDSVTELPPDKESPVKTPEPTGDQMLYSKILQSYRKRHLSELEKSLALLMKTYPDSVYADNALYICGQLAYELGDYKLAAQYMDRVLRQYPKGNKAVSALFAKAVIEKKQSRFEEAKRLLERLKEQYPGSPEAMRVATELKLIEMAQKQKRGM